MDGRLGPIKGEYSVLLQRAQIIFISLLCIIRAPDAVAGKASAGLGRIEIDMSAKIVYKSGYKYKYGEARADVADCSRDTR